MTAEWDENPPLVVLVDALVRGFGGRAKEAGASTGVDVLPPPISDSDISVLVREAGPNLPVVAHDPGLPASPPVLDLDAMKHRNLERAAALAKRVMETRGARG